VRFEVEDLNVDNYQGNAVVNYTDKETPWTRIIEHKWFTFGKDRNGKDIDHTIISKEYSQEWKEGIDPYYPINDENNNKLYEEYKYIAGQEAPNVIFAGRLGEYKYYDMDKAIESALHTCGKLFEEE
jgi:UDP-galactopyranose mutase